jgi:hypothetical protein
LAKNPAELEANIALAQFCLTAKDPWGAELCYRRVTLYHPEVMHAWNRFVSFNGGEEATVRDALARRVEFQAAISLHESGRLADARAAYRAILGQRSNHSAGWNLELLNLDSASVSAAIYVCYSKPYPALRDQFHHPIHVGRALAEIEIGFPGDDSGENISSKNRGYCELTGHYWAWKNDRTAEYVGLAHYRRLFMFAPITDATISRFDRKPIPVEASAADFIRPAVASALIGSADVVLPKPWRIRATLERQFIVSAPPGSSDDWAALWHLMIVALRRNYRPVHDGGQGALEGDAAGYFFNMFVMRRPLFEAYSAMLFDVLERVEDAARALGIPVLENRELGFLAERFMSIYAGYLRGQQQVTIREVPVVHLV